MNEQLLRGTLYILGALFLAAALIVVAGEPAAPADEPTQLDTVVVHPPRPPLDEPLRLLRLLADQSTPCLGCDAVLVPARENPAVSLLKYILMPTPPPAVDEATQMRFDVRTHDDPSLEYLRR